MDSSPLAVTARAADGRGLLWWAYEFKNVHVLGSILAFEGDIESDVKDAGGETAQEQCLKDSYCNKD